MSRRLAVTPLPVWNGIGGLGRSEGFSPLQWPKRSSVSTCQPAFILDAEAAWTALRR